MKRNLKNTIMILIIIALGVGSYFTIQNARETQETTTSEIQQRKTGENTQETPPEKSSEDTSNENSQNTPPERPSEDMSNENSQNTPPEKPSGDTSNENSQNTSPEKPSGNMSNENNQGTPPEMPSNMPNMNQEILQDKTTIKTSAYILFGIESLGASLILVYLIMSKFNKLTLKETITNMDKTIIFILLVIIITTIITIAQIYISKNVNTENEVQKTNNSQMMPEGGNESSASITKTGATTLNGTTEELTENYATSNADESVILVENGGNATIKNAQVSKNGGDSTNTENSEFYGVNSGILVTENSTATIKNTTISTNAKGSNAVFSTGTNSKIYINDSTITTTGSGSARGLDATYGGYIEADNVTIKTQGGSCATLATDRGEGTVIVKNSKLETNGSGSPVIYSTGDISIENTEGIANGSQMVVIEGKNTATVTNSTLTASGTGNRGETDQAGIMIYQSMSGDAGQGTGTFTAQSSDLNIQTTSKYYKTAPMFFITNTDAIVNLTDCKISYGSGVLISSKGTSEWGKTGSNGGNLTFNANNQVLEGDIEIDNISTLNMNLTESTYAGTINSEKTAKQITIKLDKNSKIVLTGDSYITSLEDEDASYSNIDFNGYKLYVNGTTIN